MLIQKALQTPIAMFDKMEKYFSSTPYKRVKI